MGSENIFVRRITEVDISETAQVARLEKESFPDPWSLAEITSSLGQSSMRVFVAQEGSDVLGYIICQVVHPECEIDRIAVDPNRRRGGVGQILFDHLTAECRSCGDDRIILDVRESNAPAIGFYKKNGFLVEGKRKNFYGGEHPEDAILMGLDLV